MAARGTRNNSTIPANVSTSMQYLSIPIDHRVKVFLGFLYSFVSVYAIVANVLILHFKKDHKRQTRKNPERALSRNITNIFVQSLAWSDILCGLVTFPVVIATFYVDVLRYDWVCKSVRYVSFVFPVITVINLFTIGIERYMGIFHPLIAPSKGTVKKLLVCAWIIGGVGSFIPAFGMFSSVRHETGPESYTLTCVANTQIFHVRVLMIISSSVLYVIPSITLTITNTRILVFLRRRRKQNGNNQTKNDYIITNTFVILMISYILPYLICVINSVLKAFFKPHLSYTLDYSIRHLCGFLAYANSAVSPTVMFWSMPDLNRKLKRFLHQRLRVRPTDTSLPVSGQLPKRQTDLECNSPVEVTQVNNQRVTSERISHETDPNYRKDLEPSHLVVEAICNAQLTVHFPMEQDEHGLNTAL